MERNNSSSLRRALTLLDRIAELTPVGGAGLTDLAASATVHKSTVVRLLAPLSEAGLIRSDDGRYVLGARTAQLGRVFLDSLDLRSAARPVLRRLVEDTDETVHLVIADLPDVVYVDKVEGTSRVRMYSTIGSRQPAYCTGVGKAYLAFAEDHDVDTVLSGELALRTERTITDPQALRAHLAVVREQGYAVDDVENEPGIRCVAAPVFDHAGGVVAALSVSGPVDRMLASRTSALGAMVRRAGLDISAALGRSPADHR